MVMKYIKNGVGTIHGAIKYFFLELLGAQSVRIQLLWFTAFWWCFFHFYFGLVMPWVRELSCIYYRQNSMLNALAIDLNSTYATQILNSMDMAFAGTVISYVASNWKRYGPSADLKGQKIITKKEDEVKES